MLRASIESVDFIWLWFYFYFKKMVYKFVVDYVYWRIPNEIIRFKNKSTNICQGERRVLRIIYEKINKQLQVKRHSKKSGLLGIGNQNPFKLINRSGIN